MAHRDRDNQERPPMSPDRLIRAADLLLAARANDEESGAFVDAWLGRADEATGDNGLFTYEELVEGMCFLMRCGLVEPSQPAVSRSGPRRRPSH